MYYRHYKDNRGSGFINSGYPPVAKLRLLDLANSEVNSRYCILKYNS